LVGWEGQDSPRAVAVWTPFAIGQTFKNTFVVEFMGMRKREITLLYHVMSKWINEFKKQQKS
jgi:hypothetical protein